MSAQVFPGEGMELTHILVVGDGGRARDFYVDVLGAELYREYGGTSVVLRMFGPGCCWSPGVGRRPTSRR
jgi:catechol 2,3-dioxygenase-like lactoylglutathione lyase family enzyme